MVALLIRVLTVAVAIAANTVVVTEAIVKVVSITATAITH